MDDEIYDVDIVCPHCENMTLVNGNDFDVGVKDEFDCDECGSIFYVKKSQVGDFYDFHVTRK